MKFTNDNFPLIVNDFYNSEEVNKIFADLCYTKSKSEYGKLLLKLLKKQQEIFNGYDLSNKKEECK